jgi:hypothetical protein
VKGLNEIGLDCREPGGAFYAFPSIKRTGLSSEEFAERLLMEERVAVVPGGAFGPSGEGFVRCSYATALSQLEQALVRMNRFVSRLTVASVLTGGLLAAGMAKADRVIFTPEGAPLPPDSVKLEYLIKPERRNSSFAWAQYSSPEGIELEFNRVDRASDPKNRYSFNIQYPMLQDLGATPALSLGVRDLMQTGQERLSFYFSIGKSVPLSDRQAKWVQDLRWNLGAGTGYFNGGFLGIQVKFRSGITLAAELMRYRPNVSLSLPLVRNLQAKAYSLNGDIFYGLTYSLLR